MQFIPVINATNAVLATTTEEKIIERIFQLSNQIDDFELIRYCCTPLNLFNTKPRLDTPARAVSAGFWYLHQKQPDKALKAFEKVRHLNHGNRMYALADILNQFSHAKDIDSIIKLEKPNLPSPPYLHLTTRNNESIIHSGRKPQSNRKRK